MEFQHTKKEFHGAGERRLVFCSLFYTRIRCLVREYIQNSFDAHSGDDDKPVRVEFEFVNFLVPIILN